jgi:hypothetical protein
LRQFSLRFGDASLLLIDGFELHDLVTGSQQGINILDRLVNVLAFCQLKGLG